MLHGRAVIPDGETHFRMNLTHTLLKRWLRPEPRVHFVNFWKNGERLPGKSTAVDLTVFGTSQLVVTFQNDRADRCRKDTARSWLAEKFTCHRIARTLAELRQADRNVDGNNGNTLKAFEKLAERCEDVTAHSIVPLLKTEPTPTTTINASNVHT